MNSNLNYKLTKHPIGSLKEIWTISWPLMLSLLSSSFMMFADRLFLARYSTDALNACATAGMATYAFMILPLITAGISEVFVGRNHGAGKLTETGKPVWQMIWLSCLTLPIFWIGGGLLAPLFFKGTGNTVLESLYFQWIIYFAPFFCSTIALTGFFVGIGQVKIITLCAIIGNLINIGLDAVLIFGLGYFPEMGVKGAALATGLSQLAQTLFLMLLFLRKNHQQIYGTINWKFDLPCFLESIQIGVPAALGRFLEIIAHFIFFRIVILSGSENLTILTIVQSFYLLMSFMIEGLSKGVSSITANLIGGKQNLLISKVLKSSMTLHSGFACLFSFVILLFSKPLLAFFFSENQAILLENPQFLSTSQWALFWMSIFFLFDGFGWIYMGLLTASGDTKFLLYASIVLNWLCYILPAYILLGIAKGNAAQGWLLITLYAFITFLTYLWRYKSGKWLHTSSYSFKEPLLSTNQN